MHRRRGRSDGAGGMAHGGEAGQAAAFGLKSVDRQCVVAQAARVGSGMVLLEAEPIPQA